ncbi:MAG: hypothetical protein ACJ74Z_17590 [Bryobacteraceae bacterium]
MKGRKPLSLGGRFEAAHLPFPFARGLRGDYPGQAPASFAELDSILAVAAKLLAPKAV